MKRKTLVSFAVLTTLSGVGKAQLVLDLQLSTINGNGFAESRATSEPLADSFRIGPPPAGETARQPIDERYSDSAMIQTTGSSAATASSEVVQQRSFNFSYGQERFRGITFHATGEAVAATPSGPPLVSAGAAATSSMIAEFRVPGDAGERLFAVSGSVAGLPPPDAVDPGTPGAFSGVRMSDITDNLTRYKSDPVTHRLDRILPGAIVYERITDGPFSETLKLTPGRTYRLEAGFERLRALSGARRSSEDPAPPLSAHATVDLQMSLVAPACGDESTDLPEQCDDGNGDPNDGCDPSCMREPDYASCSGVPSTCNLDKAKIDLGAPDLPPIISQGATPSFTVPVTSTFAQSHGEALTLELWRSLDSTCNGSSGDETVGTCTLSNLPASGASASALCSESEMTYTQGDFYICACLALEENSKRCGSAKAVTVPEVGGGLCALTSLGVIGQMARCGRSRGRAS